MRLGADRGRVEEDVGAHQHHRRGFGDTIRSRQTQKNSQRREMRTLPNTKTGIAWAEVEFLLVAPGRRECGSCGRLRDFAVRADHRKRVVDSAARQPRRSSWGSRSSAPSPTPAGEHRRMLIRGTRVGEQALVLDAAEIGALKQFGGKHDFGALAGGVAHELGHGANVRRPCSVNASCSAATVSLVMTFPVLRRRPEVPDLDGPGMRREPCYAGTCWLIQWKLPPPVRMWSARSPTATRSGNSAWTASTAAQSLAAPY